MHILLMAIQIILAPFENFFSKQYDVKTKHFNLWLFSGTTILGATLYFLCSIKFEIPFVADLLPYALAFSLTYAGTMIASVLALKKGEYGPTMLIHSYSTIPPALFGIVFLHEKVSFFWYIGFVLTLISIYLINNDGKAKGSFSFIWLFWVIVSFACNALAVIVLKLAQVHFDGVYNNLLMVYAMLPLSIVLLLVGVLRGKKRGMEIVDACKYGLPRGAISGITNFLGLILIGMIPASMLYPMSSAFGIVGTYLISVLIFREKLTKKGVLACMFGIVATACLNL